MLPIRNMAIISNSNELGAAIRAERKRLGVTQKELAMAAGTVLLFINTVVLGDQAIVASGMLIEHGDVVNRDPGAPFGGNANFTIDDLCAASPVLGMAMNDMVNGIEREMTNAGSPVNMYTLESRGGPSRYDIEDSMGKARDIMCDNSTPKAYVSPFVVVYSSCRMAMYTRDNMMAINIEPGDQGIASMVLADHTTRDVMAMNLTRAVTVTAANPIIGGGWSEGIELVSTGETGLIGNFETEHFTFSSTGGLGNDDGTGALTEAQVEAGAVNNDMGMFGNMISVTTKGDVWIAEDVEGIEIAQSFYENLSSRAYPGEGASFFRGLIDSNVSMLRKGMPIRVESETSSKVLGRSMVGGKSESVIHSTMLMDVTSGWCDERPLPEGYTLTDINEQLDQVMGSGELSAAMNSPEMAEAMQQANEAMAQMSDEEKAMMEQFGLGGMLGGAASVDSSSDASGAAGAGALVAGSGAGSSGSGKAMPSSAELTTDDLLESVQKHLDALGYNPGNTDGTASVMTEVAISQFQAENGMAVVGKVTPQVLGVLSAKVDSK